MLVRCLCWDDTDRCWSSVGAGMMSVGLSFGMTGVVRCLCLDDRCWSGVCADDICWLGVCVGMKSVCKVSGL